MNRTYGITLASISKADAYRGWCELCKSWMFLEQDLSQLEAKLNDHLSTLHKVTDPKIEGPP